MAKRISGVRPEELEAENKELRARLAEAEETLHAIQSGEVDAVVVSGPEGEQVFTLRGAEYAYRSLVEAMNEGAATISAEGTILYCNKKFTSLLQLPQETVIGNPVISLISVADQQSFTTLFCNALFGDMGKAEIHLQLSDGSASPTYVSLSPLQVNDAPAACMVVTDLRELKKSEGVIAAGNLARSILEHATEAIAVCDQDGRIVMANEALRQLCGREPLLEHLDNLLPLEVVIGNSETGPVTRPFSVATALNGNRIKAEEVLLRSPEDRSREQDGKSWLLLTSGPTMIGTQVVGCVLTLLDVTHRKMAEKALLRNEKLAATGQLAASIAHEINNPLAAIHNLLFLIENEKDAKNIQSYAAMATSELMRVSHITKQTLAFYRDLTNPEKVEISQVLDEVLALYAKEIDARKVVIEKAYDIPGVVDGFRGELRQVFANLIRNAIQALNTGGRLRLYVKPTRHGGKQGVGIFVMDNGAGIKPEVRSRIFEPFFTTKGQKGTGLGLWVARDLVLKHSGFIQVRSSVTPGCSGSCFFVFFPLLAGKERA
jgi:PAS domain S-box-containing protein